ncbi:hypothetical protein [uncultured Desulfobacter sp.]|uniref:hypothetical protein n=1 Tax=uncultured Desulfobacter sp. TaxID=240139 RepID=UPI002AA659EF|nr:hypothetical protein [uncultured Desulfobacter sp.]
MTSFKKRLGRLEKMGAHRNYPPLVIFSHNSSEILGFKLEDRAESVMRVKGEAVRDLQDRALKYFGLDLGKARFYAITRSWGPWPYQMDLTEEEWLRCAERQQREARMKFYEQY